MLLNQRKALLLKSNQNYVNFSDAQLQPFITNVSSFPTEVLNMMIVCECFKTPWFGFD